MRGILFRLAPMAALVFAVLGLEAGLRLAGYGHSGDYFGKRDIGGVPHLVADRDWFRAYFPPNLLPSLDPLAVPEAKGPRTIRVAVLGESAALGTPDPAFGFPRILERMLRHRHPDLDFEVVNVSATAINSHVLADLAPRLEAMRPDLFVVYAGNNEMIGPYGPGTVFAPFLADIRLVKAGIFLGRTRTGQLVQSAWRRLASRGKAPERWAGLRMFRERSIAPGAPCLKPAYAHYRRNLESIVAAARGMGAKVILCTMVSNLRDFAPLSSVPAVDGSGQGLTALAHWDRGQALLDRHRDSAALRELTAARDLDALRFRADSPVNDAIRFLASVSGSAAPDAGRDVLLADAEAAIRAASPHGIPGREFFHEHVHFTFAGNHLLAAVVAAAVDTALLDAGRIAAVPGDEVLDAEVCRRELGLTGWSRLGMAEKMARLMAQSPFIDREGGPGEARRAAAEREGLEAYGGATLAPEVLEEIGQALELAPEDPVLHRLHGEYLQALGMNAEAAEEYAAVLAALPHDARTRQFLAQVLDADNRLPEAVEQYRLALAEDPGLPELRNGLGNLLARQGDTQGAIGQYRLAVQNQANLPEVYFNLGRAYAESSRPQEAAEAYRRALDLDPAFQPAARALETP